MHLFKKVFKSSVQYHFTFKFNPFHIWNHATCINFQINAVPCKYQGSLKAQQIEGWAQDCSNSNIFLKPLFRGNLDPFVNNGNLGSTVYRKKCCNLDNAFMVRRLSIGKNNHLTIQSCDQPLKYYSTSCCLWHLLRKLSFFSLKFKVCHQRTC